MPLTQSQVSDIKTLIEKTVKEIFNEECIQGIVNSVPKSAGVLNLQEVVDRQEDEIEVLKNQCKQMATKIDQLEQSSLSKNLRIFGIPEVKNEKPEEKVLDLFKSKLHIDITQSDLEQCYRLKSANSDKPSPILVKLFNYKHKSALLQNRKMLKSSKIVLTEDLTSVRYKLFSEAKQKIGTKKVWIMGGRLFTKVGGIKVSINSEDDIKKYRNIIEFADVVEPA